MKVLRHLVLIEDGLDSTLLMVSLIELILHFPFAEGLSNRPQYVRDIRDDSWLGDGATICRWKLLMA